MEENNESIKFGFLNITALILSIIALILIFIETIIELPHETAKLLNYLDFLICIFFLIEFLIRFFQSNNKLAFMKWGWIDLISSIPMVETFRFGRIFRVIRILRIVRAFKSSQLLLKHIFKNKVEGTMTSVLILSVLMIIFSSIAILQAENSPESNIRTAEDALWWTYTTITTVGYGDKYPVTTEGRIIAMVLMTFGVGVFGTFTAFIASLFVNKNKEPEN
jgi:voltage-gated potassium channel